MVNHFPIAARGYHPVRHYHLVQLHHLARGIRREQARPGVDQEQRIVTTSEYAMSEGRPEVGGPALRGQRHRLIGHTFLLHLEVHGTAQLEAPLESRKPRSTAGLSYCGKPRMKKMNGMDAMRSWVQRISRPSAFLTSSAVQEHGEVFITPIAAPPA